MNRARQDAITTEIMEIVGGAEALRCGEGGAETKRRRHQRTRAGLDTLTKTVQIELTGSEQ